MFDVVAEGERKREREKPIFQRDGGKAFTSDYHRKSGVPSNFITPQQLNKATVLIDIFEISTLCRVCVCVCVWEVNFTLVLPST